MNKYDGKDNYGKPKSAYLMKIASLTDKKLEDEAENIIWLSAYASNNHRSDFHWQVDAIYDECQKRQDKEIYNKAYGRCRRGCGF